MKFKELREATLTKTQIKKVHDKADDLPKNDFIKRYGKDGDSVRFATATKMVKKELGIEDYEEGFKSDAQRKAAFASGYKEKGKKKNEGGPGSGPRHKEVTLTRNGKTKTVKGVAAKIFTDAGWKIKEELDDKDKETIKPIIKQLQKSVKAHDKQAKQLQKDIQDEVEITEAGRPGEEVAQGYAKSIARKTDSNDHFGARSYLAFVIKDKELEQFYDSLEKMHRMTNGSGNHAVSLRQKMEPILKTRVKKKLRPDIGKILLDAL